MEEVEDEPLFCDRVAGIDIGKAEVMVTIRVPSETRKGGRQQETRKFGTTRRELLALADWLRAWQVERAGMESTSDYWKPVLFLLEREGFDCLLYQASQVKALPGRPKTDKLDSAWLAKVTERGSLAGSFVPPEEIRRLRTHTRYRRKLVQMRTAQKERCEKLLEDAHLKLSSVISDIHGVSGRDMLRAIIKGKNATGRGNPYIGGTLGEASVSVGRTQTFLGAKYRRLCTHMPRKKAQGAIMRTQLVIAHALLSDPEARYEDLGPDYYERKADTRRRARSHVRGLERLGCKVSIEAIDPGTGELLPVATDR
jgi:Transposase